MSRNIQIVMPLKTVQAVRRWIHPFALLAAVCLFLPIAAYAQSGSPFDSGLTSLQTLFTGTVAKVASLIAIVIGGYGFAHGEPGAKKQGRAVLIRVEQYADHRGGLCAACDRG